MASLDFKMNIVAVGKTGSGKSSTLNSIATLIGGLSTPPFSANSGVNSVTSSIELVSIKTNDGKAVQLVDTVGLFDTNLTKKLNFLDHIDECSASLLIEVFVSGNSLN